MSEPVSICWIFPGGPWGSEDRPRFPRAESWATGSGLLAIGNLAYGVLHRRIVYTL